MRTYVIYTATEIDSPVVDDRGQYINIYILTRGISDVHAVRALVHNSYTHKACTAYMKYVCAFGM